MRHPAALALALLLLAGCEQEAPTPPELDAPPVPPALHGCLELRLGGRATIAQDDLRNPASRWCYLSLDRRGDRGLLAVAWRPGVELDCATPVLDHSGRIELLVTRPEQLHYREPDTARRELREQEVQVPAETWELTGNVSFRPEGPVIEGQARVVTTLPGGARHEYQLAFTAVPSEAGDPDTRRALEREQLRLLREPLPGTDLATRAASW